MKMEFYLDVSWSCDLCRITVSRSISRQLSLSNKHSEVVEQSGSRIQWIRCHLCFRSYHLACLARRHGAHFDDYVLFSRAPFVCIGCIERENGE